MPWAVRRRIIYALGVFVFLAVVIGAPVAYHFFSIKPTCHDGKQNQGETSPDHGGPCLFLDATSLQSSAILWARTFKVRAGLYDAVAYIDNPNAAAGVMSVGYRFGLYDAQNVLVSERTGNTFVMPGGITPVFVGGIDTGSRDAVRAYLEFTEPRVWIRASNTAKAVVVTNPSVSSIDTEPRVTAIATNNSVRSVTSVIFVATVFDPAGNAIALSLMAVSCDALGLPW